MRIKLEYELDIEEIVAATSASNSSITGKINHICTNSKECCPNDLFFALNGEHYSGDDFLTEAISNGAIPLTSKEGYYGIHVKDAKHALLDLSEYYLSRFDNLKEIICITGSVGKTTTKEFLYTLLKDSLITYATIKNYNNEIGVPLTVFSAPRQCEVMILEFGTNRTGEIANLSKHIHPTLSIITNIGTSHIGNFGSKEIIAKEKSEILTGMQKPMLITEYGESLLDSITEKQTVSCQSPSADYFLLPIKEDITGSTFDFFCDKGMLTGVRFNIAGRHMLSALALAISAAFSIGLSEKDVESAISKIGYSQIRHSFIKINDYYILDDSYNSSRESVFADIQLLKYYKTNNLSALFGDILELGNNTEKIHREIGAFAYKSGIERLYLFGEHSRFTKIGAMDAGMSPNMIHLNTDVNNPYATAMDIINYHKPGDIILFKASHKINLGRIIEILKAKERNYDA